MNEQFDLPRVRYKPKWMNNVFDELQRILLTVPGEQSWRVFVVVIVSCFSTVCPKREWMLVVCWWFDSWWFILLKKLSYLWKSMSNSNIQMNMMKHEVRRRCWSGLKTEQHNKSSVRQGWPTLLCIRMLLSFSLFEGWGMDLLYFLSGFPFVLNLALVWWFDGVVVKSLYSFFYGNLVQLWNIGIMRIGFYAFSLIVTKVHAQLIRAMSITVLFFVLQT